MYTRKHWSQPFREVIAEAWADNPAKVIASAVAAVLAVPVLWVLFLVAYYTLEALGIPGNPRP